MVLERPEKLQLKRLAYAPAGPHEDSAEGGLCSKPCADAATGALAPLLQHCCRLAGRHGYNAQLFQLALAEGLHGVSFHCRTFLQCS